MSDIAELGFRVNTADLDTAVRKLNALPAAAAGVSASAQKMAAAVEGASTAIATANTTAARAEAQKADANVRALRLTQSASKEEIKAAQAVAQRAKATLAAAQAEETRIKSLNATAMANRKVESAAKAAAAAQMEMASSRPGNKVTNAVSGGTIIPARDQMPNRFNTGNIAAQFQDIGVTAAMGMNPLQIALQQGTQLSAILNTMERPLQGIAIAFRNIINPVSLLSIGIVALIAGLLQFVNWVKVGQAILNGFADVLDACAGAMEYLAMVIALTATAWVAYQVVMAAVNWRATITSIITMTRSVATLAVTTTTAAVRMAAAWIIAGGPIAWLAAGIAALLAIVITFKEDLKNLMGFDVLEAIKTGINKTIGFFLGMFEGVWRMAQELLKKLKGESTQGIGEAFSKGMTDALNRDYIGMVGTGIHKAAKAVRRAASGLGEDDDKEKRDPFQKLVDQTQSKIDAAKAEQEAIGMTEEATARLRNETELLNEARDRGIKLTPEQRAQLIGMADDLTKVQEKTRKLKEAYDFVKDTARGFFSDMRDGLRNGETLWESFGNAVTNVINKIADKFMDSALDQLFDGLFGKGGAGKGFLEDIGTALFSAKGNAFDGGGNVIPFAKGGTFTNSIVGRPTPFTFASGGAFGVMGEAGPEAVMPLHRGPDGSLGVKMNGGGGGGTVVAVNINNYGNAKVSTNQRQTAGGVEIDVMIDEIAGQKIAEEGTASSRAVDARNNRRLISR